MRPDRADGHGHLGAVLRELGKLDESADRLRQAVHLNPENANLRSSLGLTLQMLGQLSEAEEHLLYAIKLDPNHPDAHNNLAVTLAQENRFEEAIAEYGEALRIIPDSPIFRRNRALSWLTLCDFNQGWPEFEYRWKCPGFVERPFTQPRWKGESVRGKTVLIYSEQGLGDTLQWLRYAAVIKAQGATVLAEVPPALVRLVSKIDGIDRVIPQGEALPPFDFQVPTASLPGAFKTDMHTIPNKVPYLHAESERVEFWRRQLSVLPEFKIGIAWQGNPKQGGDRLRSIPLIHFAPLARLNGVQLFSLQKDPGAEQLRELADAMPIVDLARRLDLSGGAFLDTAAAMMSLDLVITCDTAIGHLAGGLGVPVWLALAACPDWRWFEHREDSPWYPTMRLFRQTKLGRWDDVFERITDEVRKKLAPAGHPESIPVEISPGELLDKITILQIKNERIRDAGKLRNVRRELAALESAREHSLPPLEEVSSLIAELKKVNEAIWDAEDSLRASEKAKRFDSTFIEMARMVYWNNDRRSAIKRQVNEIYSADFIEEKEHPHYA
jgi:hypothetical protein